MAVVMHVVYQCWASTQSRLDVVHDAGVLYTARLDRTAVRLIKLLDPFREDPAL